MTTEKLKGKATAKQIEEWKELHGEVHFIVHEGKIVYFKKPQRAEIGHGMTVGAGNVLEMAVQTMIVCYIGGCQELMDDDVFLQSAGWRFNELIELRQVELGKL